MLGRREARPFDEIHHRHRNVGKFPAGAPRRLDIPAGQFGPLRQHRLRIAFHERKIKRPPGQAKQRHPDQLAFEKEPQKRQLAVEQLLKHRNIDPALVVADHQVIAFDAGFRHALHNDTGIGEVIDHPAVQADPALGEPHQPSVAPAPDRAEAHCGLDQRDHQQRQDMKRSTHADEHGRDQGSQESNQSGHHWIIFAWNGWPL